MDDEALTRRPDFDAAAVQTVTIGPGEALFVPVGWFHEVTALAPSMTLSLLRFRWPDDFHWLRPWPSAPALSAACST